MANRKMHPGKKVEKKPMTSSAPYKTQAKKPGTDDKSRPMRPAAHDAKQAAVAKRAKRLSGVML